MSDVKSNVISLLNEKPEYREILMKIVRHEGTIPEGKDYKGWEWSDVGVQGQRLNYLATQGILDVTYSSGSHTDYLLKDMKATKEALKEFVGEGEKETPDYEVPENIFEPIVGYEDIKKRFKRALLSRSVRQSILLVGPAASAKTLFLEEVRRLKGVVSIPGKSVTGPGFEDKVIQQPNFIIIDEYDELDGDVYSLLLNYQDPKQPFEIVKRGKMAKIDKEKKAPVFASANDLTRPSEPNLDRFWTFRFQKYSDREFERICERLLPRDFGISKELALYIAKRLRKMSTNSTIRDAERIAEVSDSEDDVDKEIKVLRKYRE